MTGIYHDPAADGFGFYERAGQHPQKPAIVMEAVDEADNTVVSYGELLERANRLANVFRAAGLKKGDVVASLQVNSPEHFETFFAAFQVGLYMVPVNTHLKSPEIAYILKDSGAKAIVASAALVDALPEDFELPVVALRVEQERVGQAGVDLGERGLGARDFEGGSTPKDSAPNNSTQNAATPNAWADYRAVLANASPEAPVGRVAGRLMAYTSGTTGNPKGVKRELKDITPEVSAWGTVRYMAQFGMQPDGVQILFSPLYHAMPAQNVSAALHMGHTVVIMQKFDPERVLQLIERHGVTGTNAVPTQFHRLLSLDADVRSRYDLSSLQNVLVAGAPFPPAMKQQMLDWWGPVIWEFFAASEGLVSVVSPADAIARPGTVGKPNDAIVVDDEGNTLPTGEVGTIYFRQDHPFVYHGDEAKTKQAIRADGYATAGDMGYIDGDGYLYLKDRRSDLIITGGVNVYPIETEQRLELHPAVADVAVIGLDDPEWGQKVVGVVQLHDGVPADEAARLAAEAELEAWCKAALSSIKVPKEWRFTPKVMRTEVGKLMHRQMRDLYQSEGSNDAG